MIDPLVGGIDLMYGLKVIIDNLPLSKLSVLDGEATLTKLSETTEEKKMRMLYRNVFCFTKENLRLLFEGKKTDAVFFGRDHYENNKWKENLKVTLQEGWQINRPGYVAGIALLKKYYGMSDISPNGQFLSLNNDENKERPKWN